MKLRIAKDGNGLFWVQEGFRVLFQAQHQWEDLAGPFREIESARLKRNDLIENYGKSDIRIEVE